MAAGLSFVPLAEDVEVGGHRFTVSALPCGAMRREVMPLAAELGNMAADPAALLGGDAFDRMLKVCHASVSRAQPGIALEELGDCLMVADVAELFAAVVRVSGLTRRDAGMGEAPRPEAPGVSGGTSTGTSPRPPAGRTPTSRTSSPSPRRRS